MYRIVSYRDPPSPLWHPALRVWDSDLISDTRLAVYS